MSPSGGVSWDGGEGKLGWGGGEVSFGEGWR